MTKSPLNQRSDKPSQAVKQGSPKPPTKAAVPSIVPSKSAPRLSPTPSPYASPGRARGAKQVSVSNAPKASAAPSRAASLQKAVNPIATATRKTPWTVEAASRIYKGTAQDNGGQVKKGTFPAVAMSQAMKASPPKNRRSK
jgi:hypothetical protein